MDGPADESWIDITSIRDVLEHVKAVDEQLEKKWSEALDSAHVASDQADQAARIGSLLAVLVRRTEQLSARLAQLGIGSTIDKFPLDIVGLGQLVGHPDSTQRIRQLLIARLNATALLVEALRGLSEKTYIELRPGVGRESWWEAGAFSLIVRRAELLVRVEDATDRAMQELEAEQPDGPVLDPFGNDWNASANLAESLVRQGFPEATVPFLLLTARQLVGAKVGVTHLELPGKLGGLLADCADTAELAGAVRLLEELSASLGEGHQPDVGASVSLAVGLTGRMIPTLLSATPECLRAAIFPA